MYGRKVQDLLYTSNSTTPHPTFYAHKQTDTRTAEMAFASFKNNQAFTYTQTDPHTVKMSFVSFKNSPAFTYIRTHSLFYTHLSSVSVQPSRSFHWFRDWECRCGWQRRWCWWGDSAVSWWNFWLIWLRLILYFCFVFFLDFYRINLKINCVFNKQYRIER